MCEIPSITGASQIIIAVLLCLFSFEALSQQTEKNGGNALHDDLSLTLFTDSLIQAVHQNDTTFIFSRVDDEVFNGFGYNIGKAVLKKIWSDPRENLAEELKKALQLGFSYSTQTNMVYAPSLWLTFPDTLNAYEYVYVLDDGVPAYAKPDTTAMIIATLLKGLMKVKSRDVSDEYKEDGGPVWLGLQSVKGDTLMVESKYLRSPLDYRFWFDKVDGQWHLMGWAAGD